MFPGIRALNFFADRKIAGIVFLGFASGLPLPLVMSTLAVWLTEEGISMKDIALFALVGTPYTIKFLWAPLVDHLNIPVLNKIGRRRSWIVITEICLAVSIIAMGFSKPSVTIEITAYMAILVAFFSATQDIVIDAYRIEILEPEKQGAGAAAVQFGYRFGMLFSGAGALIISSHTSWEITFIIMAALIFIGALTTFILGDPAKPRDSKYATWSQWATETIVNPFADFMKRRPAWALILVFIILYKLGDAFAGVLTSPFLIKIGFTKEEIAYVVKVYGLVATLVGLVAGGALVNQWGVVKSLWICGFLQMLSNLMFVWQAGIGHNISALILTISMENFAAGMGATAIVAYISNLCSKEFTATQYALLSSVSAIGRTWLSAYSGFAQEHLGWVLFFLLTTIMAVPGLLLLWPISRITKEDHPKREKIPKI